MKTEQEQIKAIKQIIDERVETTLGQVQGRHDNVIKTVDTVIIARDIVNAGYGDVTEYKAENERLTKILNSLMFSEKETDIFGKPALLMFAGVKVEEAIKRVTEYDGLNAEIERLRTTLGQCNTELNSALESLKSQCREIGELKAKVKQAQIDVLNEVRERLTKGRVANDTVVINANYEIDELIKEVQNAENKG